MASVFLFWEENLFWLGREVKNFELKVNSFMESRETLAYKLLFS